MIPQGNVDSEGGGMAQSFAPLSGHAGLTSGNYDSEFYSSGVNADWFERNLNTFSQRPEKDGVAFYQQLGQQLMQAMRPQQTQQEQPLSLGGSLTEGFNMDWLSERLAAGSANGAKIGGMGK